VSTRDPLVIDQKGNLFGTALILGGWAKYAGTVFKLPTDSMMITVLANFPSTEQPAGGLFIDSNGTLYGTTHSSVTLNASTLFEVVMDSGRITTLDSFPNTSNGSYPNGDLIMESSGNLYGLMNEEDDSPTGGVYEWQVGPITLNPATLPAETVGASYSQTLTASGGTAPYTFAVTAGSLPKGLTLSAGGVLSGTPTAAGTSSFTVTATDTNGETGSQAYSVTANPTNLSFGSVAVGTYHGTTSLSATLSHSGNPVANESVTFTMNGTNVGAAMTDANGVATLSASLGTLSPGTYKGYVGASFAGDSTYVASSTTTDLIVNPAPLTVSGIGAKDKLYDSTSSATLNTATATLVGVYRGDTVKLNPTAATGTFASKDVGTNITVTVAGLTLGGAQAGDYTLTQPATTANITPAGLGVSGVLANSKVYDGTTTAASLNTAGVALVGVYRGDTVKLNPTAVTGTFASKDVGTNIAVRVAGLTLGGAQAGDYTLTQPATMANITPAPLQITADDKSVFHGNGLPLLTASYSGFITGETPAKFSSCKKGAKRCFP
jgi:hypothetical protein